MSDELTSPMFDEPASDDPGVVDMTSLSSEAPHASDGVPTTWLSFDVGSEAASGNPKPPNMAIREGEPLGSGLRRISLEQFDVAIGNLADPDVHRDTAVHEARKAMKRIRAIVRLVRDQLGDDVYGTENAVLRDTARLLSDARSAAVMGRALDHLITEYAEAQPELFLHLREGLRRRHVELTDQVAGQAGLIDHVLSELRGARSRFADWPTSDSSGEPGATEAAPFIADEFASIAPGIRRVYARGKRSMAQALARPSVHAFHEWRKRVKYLRYQMEALIPIWPEVMSGLEASLNTLTETLGEDHDLAELSEFAVLNPDLCSDGERRLLGAIITKQRAAMQHHAALLGARIYFERPDSFTQRIGAYWEAWHTP